LHVAAAANADSADTANAMFFTNNQNQLSNQSRNEETRDVTMEMADNRHAQPLKEVLEAINVLRLLSNPQDAQHDRDLDLKEVALTVSEGCKAVQLLPPGDRTAVKYRQLNAGAALVIEKLLAELRRLEDGNAQLAQNVKDQATQAELQRAAVNNSRRTEQNARDEVSKPQRQSSQSSQPSPKRRRTPKSIPWVFWNNLTKVQPSDVCESLDPVVAGLCNDQGNSSADPLPTVVAEDARGGSFRIRNVGFLQTFYKTSLYTLIPFVSNALSTLTCGDFGLTLEQHNADQGLKLTFTRAPTLEPSAPSNGGGPLISRVFISTSKLVSSDLQVADPYFVYMQTNNKPKDSKNNTTVFNYSVDIVFALPPTPVKLTKLRLRFEFKDANVQLCLQVRAGLSAKLLTPQEASPEPALAGSDGESSFVTPHSTAQADYFVVEYELRMAPNNALPETVEDVVLSDVLSQLDSTSLSSEDAKNYGFGNETLFGDTRLVQLNVGSIQLRNSHENIKIEAHKADRMQGTCTISYVLAATMPLAMGAGSDDDGLSASMYPLGTFKDVSTRFGFMTAPSTFNPKLKDTLAEGFIKAMNAATTKGEGPSRLMQLPYRGDATNAVLFMALQRAARKIVRQVYQQLSHLDKGTSRLVAYSAKINQAPQTREATIYYTELVKAMQINRLQETRQLVQQDMPSSSTAGAPARRSKKLQAQSDAAKELILMSQSSLPEQRVAPDVTFTSLQSQPAPVPQPVPLPLPRNMPPQQPSMPPQFMPGMPGIPGQPMIFDDMTDSLDNLQPFYEQTKQTMAQSVQDAFARGPM